MSEYRYNANALQFEADLTDDLQELARESAAKEAQLASTQRSKRDGGLNRIAAGATPLDAVKAIIEAKKKPAVQAVLEHEVRKELRKAAGRDMRFVESFLDHAGVQHETKD
jgi:hypothetical protein